MTRIGKEIITTHHRISRSYTVQQSCKQIIAPDYTDFTDREKLLSAPFIFLPGFSREFLGLKPLHLDRRASKALNPALKCGRNPSPSSTRLSRPVFWVGTGSRGWPQRVAEALYCHQNGKEIPVRAASKNFVKETRSCKIVV